MSNYQSVKAWQKAMDLAEAVYDAAETFARPGYFMLADQIRNAALSIPSNIAEGNGRGSYRDYRKFVFYARGSAMEVETQIIFARRRKLITEDMEKALLRRTVETARSINWLLKYLKTRMQPARPEIE